MKDITFKEKCILETTKYVKKEQKIDLKIDSTYTKPHQQLLKDIPNLIVKYIKKHQDSSITFKSFPRGIFIYKISPENEEVQISNVNLYSKKTLQNFKFTYLRVHSNETNFDLEWECSKHNFLQKLYSDLLKYEKHIINKANQIYKKDLKLLEKKAILDTLSYNNFMNLFTKIKFIEYSYFLHRLKNNGIEYNFEFNFSTVTSPLKNVRYIKLKNHQTNSPSDLLVKTIDNKEHIISVPSLSNFISQDIVNNHKSMKDRKIYSETLDNLRSLHLLLKKSKEDLASIE